MDGEMNDFLGVAREAASAAAALIASQAGGKLSDFAGNPFSIWGNETLAANSRIHDEMIKVANAVAHARVDSTVTE